MFKKKDLLSGLRTSIVGKKFFLFDTIDSTNTCAKALAEAGTEEGFVVVTEYQTSGKGRLGRSWKADPEKNLLFSVLLRPKVRKESSGLLTFYAAMAVARAVESLTGSKVECKWPNDLLINGKKICGILIENALENEHIEYSVVGIGLNVNQKSFAKEIGHKATSIANELNVELDRTKLLKTILVEIDKLYVQVKEEKYHLILKEWNDRCSMYGKMVSVQQGKITWSGIAKELSPDGGLVIETQNGLHTVHAGDVTLI